MNRDRIFHFTYAKDDGEDEAVAETLSGPLRQWLSVRHDRRVDEVDDAIRNAAAGITTVNLMPKEIARTYGVAE